MKQSRLSYSILFMLFVSILFAIPSFKSSSTQLKPAQIDNTLVNAGADYWDQGLAEISRYQLKQNRYQDVHPGEMVMVFVKEDFLTDKQVKNDNYTNTNSIPVLKNIQSRKFTTGLYDYTQSTHIFSPFDQKNYSGVQKIQSVSSEWCGTTYTQINQMKEKYKIELRSYFESEGDQTFEIKKTLLEDELFNLIRFHPEIVPTGQFSIMPSSQFVRMSHAQFSAVEGVGTIASYQGDEFKNQNIKQYSIEFPSLDRLFTIYFHEEYPHVIEGFDDEYSSLFDSVKRRTSARLTHQIRSAYWQKNRAEDAITRDELGLRRFE